MFENRLHNGLLLRLAAQHRQQRAGAVFLHHNGGCEDLHRARLANLLRRKANRLGGHIVDVAVQLVNGVRAVAGLAQHRAHTVRRFKVLLAHAVTHALHAHNRHIAELGRKVLQQSRARRRAELALNAPAVDRHVAQNIRRSRSRNRQHTVCTAHLSRAYMHR